MSSLSSFVGCPDLASRAERTNSIVCTAEPGLLSRVRELIADGGDKPPTLADVAHALALSPRTLRRRLFDLDTRFSVLMAEVRGERTCRFLLDTSWSLERIAEEVGYSDAANLRQAVKRWTGQSPQSFRRSRQAQAVDAH